MNTHRMIQKRKEKNMSVEELAHRIGVAKSTMYRYENGFIEKIPSNKLKKIAEVLETSPSYLLEWKNEDKMHTICFHVPREITEEEEKTISEFIARTIKK